jgi:hypothetical protein
MGVIPDVMATDFHMTLATDHNICQWLLPVAKSMRVFVLCNHARLPVFTKKNSTNHEIPSPPTYLINKWYRNVHLSSI